MCVPAMPGEGVYIQDVHARCRPIPGVVQHVALTAKHNNLLAICVQKTQEIKVCLHLNMYILIFVNLLQESLPIWMH